MPNRRSKKRKQHVRTEFVFLNVPYDRQFENLFLAYIAAVNAYGFIPRAAVEIPFGRFRLDLITDLIESCE